MHIYIYIYIYGNNIGAQCGWCCCAGLAWAVWFEHIQTGIAAKEPEVAAKLQGYQQHSGPGAKLDASGQQTVPWRGFLRNRPVQALAYTHFCNNWCGLNKQLWACT